MGIVRAYQKGTLKGKATPEVQGAASSMKKKDVKKFASTKHKGLPEKKVTKESVNEDAKMAKQSDDKLKAAHTKFSGMDKSPANTFMLKRIQREMNKRKKKVVKEDYVKELEDGLVKMDYPTYMEVDELMKKIAKENDIDTTTLHMAFKTKHLMVPDDWAKRKMMEPVIIPKTPENMSCEGLTAKDRFSRDAGKIAKKKLRNKEHNKYVNFLDVDEAVNSKQQAAIAISKKQRLMDLMVAKKKKLKEEQNPEGMKLRDVEKMKRQKQLSDASKKAPVVKNKIVPLHKEGSYQDFEKKSGVKAVNPKKEPELPKTPKKKPESTYASGNPVGKANVRKMINVSKGSKREVASRGILGKIKHVITGEEYTPVTEGNLHKWFKGSKSKDGKGGWVNVVTGGTCASDEPGEGTPKCVSSSKRASMTKSERLSASRRKKKADPNQQSKSGAAKPTYVATDKKKKKVSEEYISEAGARIGRKYKRDEYGDPIKPDGSSALKKNVDKNPKDDKTPNNLMGEEIKMTRAAYKKLHPDFKSDDPKNPRTTKYEKGKGTVSHPVKFVDEAKKPVIIKLKDPSKIKVKVTDIGPGGKEVVRKDEMSEGKSPAWQRKAGKSESGGLNAKGVASYRAANPGSKLKTAVTTKPSKLKKGSKAANRRKSFCSRMKGMKAKLTSAKTARDPDSRINKSLRNGTVLLNLRWIW